MARWQVQVQVQGLAMAPLILILFRTCAWLTLGWPTRWRTHWARRWALHSSQRLRCSSQTATPPIYSHQRQPPPGRHLHLHLQQGRLGARRLLAQLHLPQVHQNRFPMARALAPLSWGAQARAWDTAGAPVQATHNCICSCNRTEPAPRAALGFLLHPALLQSLRPLPLPLPLPLRLPAWMQPLALSLSGDDASMQGRRLSCMDTHGL